MKKNYTNLKAMFAAVLLSASAFAQPINESFDNVPGLFTSGWAQQNLSSPVGTNPDWIQGNTTVFPSQATTGYIAANYNSVAGAGTISNWLFTPTRTLQNGDIITFWTRTTDGTYPDNLQVRMSTNGASVNAGTSSTTVGDFTTLLLEINPTLSNTAYPTVWTQYSITLSGLTAPTSGRIAFRYFVTNGGPTGLNSDYVGVDEYVYTPAGGGTPNVAAAHTQEYTLIPFSQLTTMNLQARLSNLGTASTNDATLKVNVYQAPNLTTPVFTQTSANTTLAAGANQLVSVGSYTPPGLGTYYFQYISNCTGNTVNSADTSVYAFTVTTSEYARDNGTSAQGVGAGNTLSVIIGNTFDITNTVQLDSVLFFCAPGTLGLNDTVRVRIASTVAGVPSNTAYIGQSNIYIFTAADTTVASGALKMLHVTNLTGGALSLTPGKYFIGLEKFKTGDNYGLQCAASIFTPNTVYANINNGAYSPLNSLLAGFNFTPIIRPIFQKCVVSATQTITACGSYTWINGTTYTTSNNTATFTVTNASGCDSLITLNLTINPVDNASVTYASNTICTGSANSVPTVATSGGTFSSSPSGLVFVSTSTGEIDVALSSANSYTVTYTTAGACPNTTTQTVTITSSPIADFTYSSNTYCSNDNNPTPVLLGSAGSFTSSPNGLSITQGTGVIDLVNSATGTYTVFNTILASGACPTVIDSVSVTVNAAPTATVSGGGNICTGDSVTVTVALTGNGPWNFTLSDGNNTSSITAFNATSYSLAVQSSGNYSVTNVSDANCSNNGSGSAVVVVNSLPVINFALANDTVCLSSGTIALSASPAGGTFSGTGVSGTTFDPSTAGAGTYAIVYSYTDANSCSNSASQSLVVDLCTGINEFVMVENVFIAPNPASDNITIAFQNQSTDVVRVNIVSMDGKLVFSDLATASSVYSKQINVSTFAKGLYFVQFVSEKGMKHFKISID